jgi:hypothetical protein
MSTGLVFSLAHETPLCCPTKAFARGDAEARRDHTFINAKRGFPARLRFNLLARFARRQISQLSDVTPKIVPPDKILRVSAFSRWKAGAPFPNVGK